MDISHEDLQSSWPTCALCCFQDFSQSAVPCQLQCWHLLCQNCALQCFQDGYYCCPFDRQYTEATCLYYNYELLTRMDEVSQSGSQLSPQAIAQFYWWFSQVVNTSGVPCRNFFNCGSCGAKNCRNSHDASTWQAQNCPAWDSCGRGQVCPFRHSWSDFSRTVAPSTYTLSQPASYQQTADAQHYDPRSSYQSQASVTVKAEQEPQVHRINIRSVSLLNDLKANDSEKLKAIAAQHQTEFSIKDFEVRYHSRVRWVFYASGKETSYDELESKRLEAAYSSRDADLEVKRDAKVNFKLMIHITPTEKFKVDRFEVITNSTNAAVIEFRMYGSPESLFAAINSHETSLPMVRFQSCRSFITIARKHGIGVIQEKMFGLSTDLNSATAEMQLAMDRQNQEIIYQMLPAGVDARAAAEIAKDLAVAVYGNRVFGAAQDILLFIGKVEVAYMSIPVPAGMGDEYIGAFCARNGLTRQGQYLFGTKENIAAAMVEMTESTTPIPPGTSEEKVQELIQTHGVRREGNLLIGQNQTMVLVVQALQNLEMSAAYPKHLLAPQVQTVCDRHNVRMDEGKIFGIQANVLAALNELNTIPAVTGFQYHQAPQWYANCPDQVVLMDLQPNDPEYTNVSNQFRQTTPNQITRIRVIQNKRLYTNFAFKHEGYSKVEGRAIEIKRLFHGTRANDPKIIYESDSGLDSRLGGGMWGNGSYYAFNSSYSTGYAHAAADGTKEMFLCEVIVGDYIQLPSNNSLKKPPLKPNSTNSYHSVKGNTGGSDIWITYEPAMSYPHFLINYR